MDPNKLKYSGRSIIQMSQVVVTNPSNISKCKSLTLSWEVDKHANYFLIQLNQLKQKMGHLLQILILWFYKNGRKSILKLVFHLSLIENITPYQSLSQQLLIRIKKSKLMIQCCIFKQKLLCLWSFMINSLLPREHKE